MPNPFIAEIAEALSCNTEGLDFSGAGALPSTFRVTDLAAASVAAAGCALADLVKGACPGASKPDLTVDRRFASFWFGWSLRPDGWEVPSVWDPIAGDYQASDGWIRLHTNAPHHRDAAVGVLGCTPDRESVAAAVSKWRADELETAIVANHGAAAAMRSRQVWADHPQGRAVNSEPLVHSELHQADRPWTRPLDPSRPLAGVRVLDLTRVLAGPVAGRFLAAYGASVLRIDPPSWNEPGVIPEVTLGKRCAGLDLTLSQDRQVFERLLAECNILLLGYRPGAMENRGYGAAERRAINPDLIDVSLCAYGWTGPWKTRRGFDSLLQMSSGIADTGMHWAHAEKPTPLPVQALDHATGYLMAAAALTGLSARIEDGSPATKRLSLARTAHLLTRQGGPETEAEHAPETDMDHSGVIEQTTWGRQEGFVFL